MNDVMTRDEALALNRQERGRALYDGEIDWYLADCQTPLRHGTADLGTEIAEQLRDRLRAHPTPVPREDALVALLNEAAEWISDGSTDSEGMDPYGYDLVQRLRAAADNPAPDARDRDPALDYRIASSSPQCGQTAHVPVVGMGVAPYCRDCGAPTTETTDHE